MNCPDRLPARSFWDHLWLGPGGASCGTARVDGHRLISGLWFVDPGHDPQWSMSRSAHVSAMVTVRASGGGPVVGLAPPCRFARPERAPDPRIGVVLHPWVQGEGDPQAVADRLQVLCSRMRESRAPTALPAPETILAQLQDLVTPEPDPCAVDLARSLAARPTRTSLEAAVHRSGLTVRSFRRRICRWFGLNPDALRRIWRAEAARRSVGFSHRSLSQVAFDLEFADQPHMTREFVELCGVTPVAWRNHVRRWCHVGA